MFLAKPLVSYRQGEEIYATSLWRTARYTGYVGKRNILLQQGGHSFVNLGDLAMLQVAVGRFRASFPDCIITVLSDPGVVASKYLDDVPTIDVHTVPRMFGPGCLFGRFARVLGKKDSAIVTRYPALMHAVSLRHR